MLTLYLDESGHEGKDVAIIAGFLGDQEQWQKCESAWRLGLQNRKRLHMKEMRWSKPERVRKLLNRLGPVPHESGLQAVFSLVRLSDYEDMVTGRLVEKLLKGYYIVLMGVLDVVRKNIPADETFKVVLETQTEYAHRAHLIFDSMRGYKTPDGRQKLVSIEYVSKDASILTQPADFFAYALLLQYRWQYRGASPERYELCSEILKNTRPAMMRNHILQPELLRTWLGNVMEKHPTLLKRWEEYD